MFEGLSPADGTKGLTNMTGDSEEKEGKFSHKKVRGKRNKTKKRYSIEQESKKRKRGKERERGESSEGKKNEGCQIYPVLSKLLLRHY